MAATLYLRVPVNSHNFKRIKIENVNLESKVDSFKDEAVKHIHLEKHGIELIYCGIILDDDVSLSSCGVKPGVMLHVLEKKESELPTPTKIMADSDVKKLVDTFTTFSRLSGYRQALHRLSRPEVLDNILATTPGLIDDPVAISMIQDPELIVHMSDLDTARRIAELHPSLAEAANHIAAAVHEDAATAISSNQPGPSSGYSYSLEALSDDEEMESSSSDGPREGQPLSRNTSYSAITAAQLAAAIANATGTFGSPGAAQNNSSAIITNEMFSSAMQQAFATTSSPQTPAATTTEDESFEAMTRRLQPQLQQMREIGLTNVSANIRALLATSGDVQAAIELVFNGLE